MKKFFSFFIFSQFLLAATPDCTYSYRFTNIPGEQTDAKVSIAISTGVAVTLPINNISSGCNAWAFSYDASGFSALSIVFQSANNTGGVTPTPGTFSTFAGNTILGTNPSTTTTSGLYTATGYYPFLNVQLSSSTGVGGINITLNGWKSPAYISSGSAGSIAKVTNLIAGNGAGGGVDSGVAASNVVQYDSNGFAHVNSANTILLGNYTSSNSYSAIYFNQPNPSGTNYAILGDLSDTFFNSTQNMYLRINNSNVLSIVYSGATWAIPNSVPEIYGNSSAPTISVSGTGCTGSYTFTTGSNNIGGDITVPTVSSCTAAVITITWSNSFGYPNSSVCPPIVDTTSSATAFVTSKTTTSCTWHSLALATGDNIQYGPISGR